MGRFVIVVAGLMLALIKAAVPASAQTKKPNILILFGEPALARSLFNGDQFANRQAGSDFRNIHRRLMRNTTRGNLSTTLLAPLVLWAGTGFIGRANAQNPELQQQVGDVKQSMAKNKQALASYTWNEQVTISLKGEEKKQEHFQVRLGPDLKPEKTSLDPPAAPPSGGRLKKHVIAKKTEEYKEYADQMKALAQQYVPPDKDLLDRAYAQGNITLGPAAGAPNEIQLILHNYLKAGDSMTMVFDKTQKQLLRLQIASYMDDPKDAMNLTVQFGRLPDGTNHVSNLVIDGVSKQLNIAVQNANYQHV